MINVVKTDSVDNLTQLHPKMVEVPYDENDQSKGFFMAASTLTTCAQYEIYCAETGADIPNDYGFGEDQRPRVGVTVIDVCNYINWLNQKVATVEKEKLDTTDPDYAQKCASIDKQYEYRYHIENNEIWEKYPGALGFQLPTEVEWVALAGDVDKMPLDEVAWYAANSDNITHPVALKKPNKWGIYDVFGNAWKIIQEYANGKKKDYK